jgi:hypothetical protein
VISPSTRVSGPCGEKIQATYRTSALCAAALSRQVLSPFAFPSPPRLHHHLGCRGHLRHQPPQHLSLAKVRRQARANATWLQSRWNITTTYALKQIVQLTNRLLLLPLHTANPDSGPVDGPFAPDRSTILCGLLEGVFEHDTRASALTERYRFLGLSWPSRGRLALDIAPPTLLVVVRIDGGDHCRYIRDRRGKSTPPALFVLTNLR